MVIDKSRDWWAGSAAADLDEYLPLLTAEDIPVTRVVHASCGSCNGTVFRLSLDDAEGCVVRTCAACKDETFMLDTAEYADDAEQTVVTCPRKKAHRTFEVAVGFALRDDGEIRWVYVGLRCTQDGLLGAVADWSIDEAPSTHLFDQV